MTGCHRFPARRRKITTTIEVFTMLKLPNWLRGFYPAETKHSLKIRSHRNVRGKSKQIGKLWHYGHFMHDFVMPFNDWLFAAEIDSCDLTIYFEDTPDQSVGALIKHVRVLFGVRAKILPPEKFHALPYDTLELHAYLSGPFSKQSCDQLLANVLARFDLVERSSPASIILIERGVTRHGFERRTDVDKSAKMTGKQRRRINNHAALVEMLSDRYGNNFKNVVLDKMKIEDQVIIFYHSHLVIGQHGAGLNNLLWMKDSGGKVIEIGPRESRTFINLCAAKEVDYHLIDMPADNPGNLHLEDMCLLLDKLEAKDPTLANCRTIG